LEYFKFLEIQDLGLHEGWVTMNLRMVDDNGLGVTLTSEGG